jgi:hypothetical protein
MLMEVVLDVTGGQNMPQTLEADWGHFVPCLVNSPAPIESHAKTIPFDVCLRVQ